MSAMDLAHQGSDRQIQMRQDRNIRHARRFVLTFAAIGAFCVLIYSLHGSVSWLWVKVLGPALLIANASFAAGGFLGFLFGIPRSVQAQASEEKSKEPVREKAGRFLYRGNSNLEQISDWLTKIIVGVGLVELKGAPALFQRLAYFVGSSFASAGAPRNDSIALSIVVLFATVGFFLAYLMARLFLQNALSMAESPNEEKIAEAVDSVGVAAASLPPPELGGAIPETQIRAGERVRELSRTADQDNLRKQLLDVAESYDQLRRTPSSAERTSSMEAIVAKFRALAPSTYAFLDEMAEADTAGKRLAAVAMLQLNPQPNYLEWLADRVISEKQPFVGYHSALALLYSAQRLRPQDRPAILEAIKRAETDLAAKGLVNTDRMKVLGKAREMIAPQ